MIKPVTRELSIQVKLNGLSFCVLNTSTQSISYINVLDFKYQLTPNDVLKHLKDELSSNIAYSEDFSAVHLIYFNELATLVPKALYNEAHHADYLKFNSKILKTDFITTDELKNQDIITIYVPYVNINNYIFDTFGSFSYKHAASVFIESISALIKHNNTKTPQLFINVDDNAMQIAVFKNTSLQLYNYFDFSSPEDFIYYILFTVEQLQLSPETVQVYLCGSIDKQDRFYKILYTYVRHVAFISEYTTENTATINAESHNNYILKHSF